jgi:hypothetical protein
LDGAPIGVQRSSSWRLSPAARVAGDRRSRAAVPGAADCPGCRRLPARSETSLPTRRVTTSARPSWLRPTSGVRLTWTGWRRRDQDQAVFRPSNVKSRQDTTGQDENKPAGQSKLAAQPPQAHLPGQEKSGISRPSRPPVSPQGAAVCVPLLRPHVRRPRRPFHEHSSPLHT